ncbi:sirohydrochlorin chelatase [Actinomadura sp. NAK00032]|uniref:sirohydrochlorin chelatase n=1 Tax=Actinomadura sp. NAK00032 TaxID=2742128 RepID=UPI0020C787B9|nr:sirohydrochlorin chelatase [Actinomadura sp. NAK00032]
MAEPALLAVAHGTRDPAGPAAVRALLARVRAMRPGLRVAEAYGELAEPSLEDAAAALGGGPVVLVPLLLARGYHALADFPGRAARLLPGAVASRPLGPDPLLAHALADRLAGRLTGCLSGRSPIGIPPRPDAVVLGAAGSADPAGTADAREAARLLARRLGRPVRHGFVAAGGPVLDEVVADLRRGGARRVAVASYLLAPGRFHDRIAACGADAAAPPIGAHPAAARLVLRRYDEARSGAAAPVRAQVSRPVS